MPSITRVDAPRARQMMQEGVPFVDALPAEIFVQEHLPGAISLPLRDMTTEAVERARLAGLKRTAPLVVYCFDQRCDLSARAAHRFAQLGFRHVHDLIGGRTAWTVLGYPTEGEVADRRRIAQHVSDAPSVHIGDTIADVRAVLLPGRPIAVVDDDGVLLGALQPVAAQLPPATSVDEIMLLAPSTVRVDQRVDDVVVQLRRDHLDHAYVTNADGVLVGLVIPDDVHV
jgi:rhodanese-related sulfurtransferase/CBS domain-containing protein